MTTTFRILAAACLAVVVGEATASAQDPLVVAPEAYQKVLENEWVRVVRVRYAPQARIPAHFHTERAAAYVYLNDGGPVLFAHVDTSYKDVVRPATKAGSYRLFRGIKEVHAVENPNEVESHFLRVELKTEVVDVAKLRGRYFREPFAPDQNLERVEFENGQLRVTRVVIAPGQRLELSAGASEPAVLVALVPARLAATVDGGVPARTEVAPGDARWLAASGRLHFENAGDAPAELLRFDLRTPPFDDPGDRTEAHDHQSHDHGAAEATANGG